MALYQMPRRRKWAAIKLSKLLKNHGDEIAEHLAPRMSAVLEEGEELPDVAHLLDVLGRMLMHESEGLDAADDARVTEGADLSLTRKQMRRRVAPELRSRVIWARDQMRNAYGAEKAARLLDFEGRTPRGRRDLEDLAIVLVSRLPGLEPPKTKARPPPNLTAWADYVRPALEEFKWHLDEIQGRSTNESVVVGVKNEALADFDRTYRRVVRMTELFYELAGLEKAIEFLRQPRGRSAEQTRARPSGVA